MRDRTVPSQAPFSFQVTAGKIVSETDPEVTYDVQLPFCSCPSFRYTKPGIRPWCKHLDEALETVGEWKARQSS